MKHEATRQTVALQCEICAITVTYDKISYDKIYPIETLVEYGSATNFKGFEALHNIVFNIDDQVLCSDVQTEVGQMYDEL